ncbi:hypothetical protein K438DRAFT_1817158 [Mycena galopus ATCC 62051]|nr:hypothetical protein K438DRAFT_1817158 [Mycena galopus ATCC 62051]
MPLPQELVDMVVNNIRDDIPALKCCSLAARTFVGSARIHIFRKIQINPPEDPPLSSCEKLYQFLSSSPHIAPLVEDLCIVLVGSKASISMQEHHVSWIMADRTLSLVLPLLELKRISLVENAPPDWNSGGKYSMNWNKMEQPLKSALASVFSSPNLEAVHLRGIMIESPCQLLSLFSEATALEEISLSRLYFTQRRQDQLERWPESQPWRPQLRSLLAHDFDNLPFCHYLVNPQIHLANVRSLTLSTNYSDTVNTIIQGTKLECSGGVEHLRVFIWSERSWT